MSHNQQMYYPKEDNDDQQRFFAWNSQAANHLDNGHQRYDSSNNDNKYNFGFSFPSYNPLAVAPAAPRPPSPSNRSNTAPITPASSPNSTDLVPTQPKTPSPTSLVPTEPNMPVLPRCHPIYSANKFLGLTGAVVDVNPFGAKHGKKAVQWEEVAHCVKAKGLFTQSSTDVIKNKALALIKYQEVRTLFRFCSHLH